MSRIGWFGHDTKAKVKHTQKKQMSEKQLLQLHSLVHQRPCMCDRDCWSHTARIPAKHPKQRRQKWQANTTSGSHFLNTSYYYSLQALSSLTWRQIVDVYDTSLRNPLTYLVSKLLNLQVHSTGTPVLILQLWGVTHQSWDRHCGAKDIVET